MSKVMEEMREETRITDYVSSVASLMKNLKFTKEQAILALDIPDEYKELVIAKISK